MARFPMNPMGQYGVIALTIGHLDVLGFFLRGTTVNVGGIGIVLITRHRTLNTFPNRSIAHCTNERSKYSRGTPCTMHINTARTGSRAPTYSMSSHRLDWESELISHVPWVLGSDWKRSIWRFLRIITSITSTPVRVAISSANASTKVHVSTTIRTRRRRENKLYRDLKRIKDSQKLR